MKDPMALVVANEVFKAVETIGMPEAGINLAHGVVYLSQAGKEKRAYEAYNRALGDAKKYGNLPIPMSIRNAPTKLMKDLGYGEGYERYTKKDLMPEELRGKKYLEDEKETDSGK
jgi:putative ATPase